MKRKDFLKNSGLLLSSIILSRNLKAGASPMGYTSMPASLQRDMVLWYRQPGEKWLEGLPIGNGYMGAMVFGGIQQERIALNESTFWSGRPQDYNDPNAINYFDQIKELVFAGKHPEARNMADKHFYGIPANQQAYQPLGDLMLTFDGGNEATDYHRELNMETGITKVRYRLGDVVYTREMFLSYPDRVLVVRIEADKPGQISFLAGLKSQYMESSKVQPGRLVMDGCWKGPMPKSWLIAQVSGKGIHFQTVLKALPEGGHSGTDGNQLKIQGANAITLILTAATSYVNYENIGGDPGRACSKILSNVEGKNYETLHSRHIDDFNNLMGRVHLHVGDESMNKKPTDERIKAVSKGGEDTNLEAICFQFGRYILASSSRSGSQPANLQGRWNESNLPPWGSKYTININEEMNYWPAEVCNLSECHQPLFDMIKDISVTGARTAGEYYGCRGWVTHHNTDSWRGTAPVDAARYGMWPVGGAWLCQHLWEHYAFTGDLDFLRTYYPIMKSSARFLLDLLVEHPKYQWLVTPFSVSPEHGFYDDNGVLSFLSPAPTMDIGIMRDLFPHCIEASKLLDIDAEFRSELEQVLPKLPPYQIDHQGFPQEWIEDWKPGNQSHNDSKKFPFYPGNSIRLRRDKKLSEAYEKWMSTRDVKRGFHLSWDICVWSRLERGDKVADGLKTYLSNSVAPNLHNLRNNQSDASFGFTAAVAESLIQSHAEEISLLPALSADWKSGSVSGLRARGGYEVSMQWNNNRLQSAKIHSRYGGPCKVRYKDRIITATVKQGETISLNADLQRIS